MGESITFGDIVLAKVQFIDTFEIKVRPALILYKEYGNVVLAGITSNPEMKGIKLSKTDGAIKNSVIKLNYIFTVSENMIDKVLFTLSKSKKQEVYTEFIEKLSSFNNL